MKVAGIRINDTSKIYYFDCNGFNLKVNSTVIVETEKGLQYGVVSKILDDVDDYNTNNLKKVIRLTTKKDYLKHLSNIKDAEKAFKKCNELISKYELDMNLIDACFTFDREQLIFRFIADDRVDFRQLAKDLGSIYKTRIELRQVGIRDKAKEIGGIGPCGRKLCCSNFLTDFDSVSINMAKNQNLSLNPSKINGVCGRLLCCLKYENEEYFEYKKDLPDVGSKVKVDSSYGKVISVDVFKRKYKVLISDTNDIVEVVLDNESKK